MGKREHIYEIIAENIRKERRRLGITQAELAERADVSLDTIKSVENGRRAMSLEYCSCIGVIAYGFDEPAAPRKTH